MRYDSKTTPSGNSRNAGGTSLLELLIAMCIAVIPVSLTGILLVAGQHSWQKTYQLTMQQPEIGGQRVVALFESIGRKSQNDKCVLFESSVEDGIERANEAKFGYLTGNGNNDNDWEYARFYLQNNELMVDQWQGSTFENFRTAALTDKVINVQFSRDVKKRCIMMELKLKEDMNDVDGETVTLTAATLIRN